MTDEIRYERIIVADVPGVQTPSPHGPMVVARISNRRAVSFSRPWFPTAPIPLAQNSEPMPRLADTRLCQGEPRSFHLARGLSLRPAHTGEIWNPDGIPGGKRKRSYVLNLKRGDA